MTVFSSDDSSNAPSHTWYSDSNTGMYHAATGVAGLAAGGVEVLLASGAGLDVGYGIQGGGAVRLAGTLHTAGAATVQGNMTFGASLYGSGFSNLSNGITYAGSTVVSELSAGTVTTGVLSTGSLAATGGVTVGGLLSTTTQSNSGTLVTGTLASATLSNTGAATVIGLLTTAN
jgi:hypothetical protein